MSTLNTTTTAIRSVFTDVEYREGAMKLRSAGVVEYNDFGDEVVEGKQLLDICGFSYIKVTTTPDGGARQESNASRVIKRQIEKHNFVEGEDYTTEVVANGRSRETVYHFNMRPANHILLSAMTQEGKAARDEAIDLKLEKETTPQTEFSNNPQVMMKQMMMGILQQQIDHDLMLEDIQKDSAETKSRLDAVEVFVDKIGPISDKPEVGFLQWREAHGLYGLSMSDSPFKNFIKAFGLETKPLTVIKDGNVTTSFQVRETDVICMMKDINENSEQETPKLWSHPLLGSRFQFKPM